MIEHFRSQICEASHRILWHVFLYRGEFHFADDYLSVRSLSLDGVQVHVASIGLDGCEVVSDDAVLVALHILRIVGIHNDAVFLAMTVEEQARTARCHGQCEVVPIGKVGICVNPNTVVAIHNASLNIQIDRTARCGVRHRGISPCSIPQMVDVRSQVSHGGFWSLHNAPLEHVFCPALGDVCIAGTCWNSQGAGGCDSIESI